MSCGAGCARESRVLFHADSTAVERSEVLARPVVASHTERFEAGTHGGDPNFCAARTGLSPLLNSYDMYAGEDGEAGVAWGLRWCLTMSPPGEGEGGLVVV